MNEKKQTKKALIMSVTSMILCVAMLVGMTFAWFTDTASTAVNKIQAGNLKVDLVDKDGNSLTGQTLAWKKATGAENETVLWEPGCTYELQDVYVKNEGNLALKYKIAITGIKSSEKLNEAIEWTINDEKLTEDHKLAAREKSNALTIKGHMKESAGNEYQGLSIDGIAITVYATQDTVESDSKDNLYDKDATYPEIKMVSDADSIAAAVSEIVEPGNKKVSVTVSKDLENTKGIVTAKGNALTLDMNGKSIGVNYGQGSKNTTTNGMQLLQGSTVTLKNGTYQAEHGVNADRNIAILIQNYSNLMVENCTLDMRNANDPSGNSKGTSYVVSSNCGNIVIKGKTNIYARSGDYALDVMHWENASYKEEGTHVVFEESMRGIVDGKIDVYCFRNNGVVKPVDDGGATLTIKGGTFKNSGLTLEQFRAFVPTGYTVTTNSDGSYTVSK